MDYTAGLRYFWVRLSRNMDESEIEDLQSPQVACMGTVLDKSHTNVYHYWSLAGSEDEVPDLEFRKQYDILGEVKWVS